MSNIDKINDLLENGFCILKAHFPVTLIEGCREAFWPILLDYLQKHRDEPNRGLHRHFLPMPFDPPCFSPAFFFDRDILSIIHEAMDTRVVADQWGCDAPVRGSEYQQAHADYQRPLFAEAPDLVLPPYILVISFGLVRITHDNGPIEIAPGSHKMSREAAARAVKSGAIEMLPIAMEIGDVLVRHPWALHRGSPNKTDMPRALVSIRYVRRWYADASREVNAISPAVWQSLSPEQQESMRFPLMPVA